MVESKSESSSLPRGPILALAGVFMTNALSSTVLLPFAAFMVDSFHVTDNRDKLGYYAGFLASSFSFGLLCSSIFWGILSDRIGRRPVLLFGLATNFVCALSFGFATSFRMAILTRFFNGLLTGVSGVGKTAVSEITNSSNQAAGFSVIGVCWGIGLLFGPALGGFLCQPVDKYPFIPIFHKGSLFDQFPYALPCMVLAALTAVGFLIVFRYLPETKGLAKAAEEEASADEGRSLVPMPPGQDSHERKRFLEGGPGAESEGGNVWSSAELGERVQMVDGTASGDYPVVGDLSEGARKPEGKRRCRQLLELGGSGRLLETDGIDTCLLREGSGSDYQSKSRRASFEVTALAVESAGVGLQGVGRVTPSHDQRTYNVFRPSESERALEEGMVEESLQRVGSKKGGVLSSLRGWLVGKKSRQPEYKRLDSHVVVGSDSEAEDDPPGPSALSKLLAPRKKSTDERGSLMRAMCEKEILVCLIIYCMLSFTFGAFDEVFPLWSLSDWHSGGLNFGTNNVGMAQTAGGVALIPFQLFVYPWLAKQVGPLNTMRIGMGTGVLLALFPLIRVAGHNRTLVQVAASGAMMVRSVSSLCIFTSIFILLTNAVSDPQHLGGMNGVAASAAAVSRAVGPTVGGSVFAWSVGQHGIFPLDYHLAFVSTGAILTATLVVSILLPSTINERKFVTG